MSDTLRTDMLLIAHDMSPEPKVLINHARELERALNNADERIKRLEEALRRIANQDYRGNRSTESQIAFDALKEVKP